MGSHQSFFLYDTNSRFVLSILQRLCWTVGVMPKEELALPDSPSFGMTKSLKDIFVAHTSSETANHVLCEVTYCTCWVTGNKFLCVLLCWWLCCIFVVKSNRNQSACERANDGSSLHSLYRLEEIKEIHTPV